MHSAKDMLSESTSPPILSFHLRSPLLIQERSKTHQSTHQLLVAPKSARIACHYPAQTCRHWGIPVSRIQWKLISFAPGSPGKWLIFALSLISQPVLLQDVDCSDDGVKLRMFWMVFPHLEQHFTSQVAISSKGSTWICPWPWRYTSCLTEKTWRDQWKQMEINMINVNGKLMESKWK